MDYLIVAILEGNGRKVEQHGDVGSGPAPWNARGIASTCAH
jgi:hypothetical protein